MNEAPYKALWASVLLMTIRDVRKHLKRTRSVEIPSGIAVIGETGESIRWLIDDSPRVGGFLWVCSVLEYDPKWVRDHIRRPRMADSKTLKRLDDFADD